eukprot:UN08592
MCIIGMEGTLEKCGPKFQLKSDDHNYLTIPNPISYTGNTMSSGNCVQNFLISKLKISITFSKIRIKGRYKPAAFDCGR